MTDIIAPAPEAQRIPPRQPARLPAAQPRETASAEPVAVLPSPPGDVERDLYLGPQHRWVTAVSFVSFVLILASVCFFVLRHPWSAFLLVPMAVATVGAVVSLITSSRRRRDTLSSHRARVAGWSPSRHASVDVFLPSAGEDLDVLANTYSHVAALRWAGQVTVYVLDDSARQAVEELASAHGFTYLSRPNRGEFKKSGNLRFGFEHSDGDLILVLDADFVPRADALTELAPYFDDPDVGIVQSPQFFDVDSRMNWLQRSAGATQMLFYRWVQPSRDRSNASICVGTSALYRRAALVRAGGYALIGHSEDVHTGVKLMRAGFRIRYVPTVVTKGLCPDDLKSFATQQYRWCSGSMSLLFSKQFHRTQLTPMQRLCYFSGFLYYLTTAVNVFAMAMPPVLMVWLFSSHVTPANYVFVLMALVLRQGLVPLITLGSDTLVGLARIQTMYSFCHALAIYDTLRGRTDGWVATGTSGSSRTSERVFRLVRRWCVGVQVALWSGIVWFTPVYGLQRWWLLIAFAALNLYVVLPLITLSSDAPTLTQLPGRLRNRWRNADPMKLPEAPAVLRGLQRVSYSRADRSGS